MTEFSPSYNLASPKNEYLARREARRKTLSALEQTEERISRARTLVFFLAVLLVYRWGWSGVGPPALVFALLWAAHHRNHEARRKVRRAIQFYEEGLARLDDRWAGSGKTGARFLDPHHPYAMDLDLFGRGSLFELLCVAVTSEGEARLAHWLLHPGERESLLRRQRGVRSLSLRLDWREAYFLEGTEVADTLAVDALRPWAAERENSLRGGARWLCAVGTLGTLLLVGACALDYVAKIWVGVWLVGQGALAYCLAGAVERVLAGLREPARHLAGLARLMAQIENEHFGDPDLEALKLKLRVKDRRASVQMRRLGRLVDLVDSQRNQFFAPIAFLLLWGTHLSFAIERWRRDCGEAVPHWLETVAELEALSSLASFTYERPEDTFPEILEGEARIEAAELGHPLLPRAHCIRNDLSLSKAGPGPQLLLVSGSNMSGKSTFLRSVGTNIVLALAGAPVRARRLELTLLAVGSTLRIQDSLQEGASRFYAELIRLRQVVELTRGPRPVCFLLDEILHGTNSHDRQTGASALIRSLAGRSTVGLVTTHDLALTKIAGELGSRVKNVYFEDQLLNGTMHFDYRMREGAISHSNALELMRSLGLDV